MGLSARRTRLGRGFPGPLGYDVFSPVPIVQYACPIDK